MEYMMFMIYYHLVIEHSHGKSPFFIAKPSINGPVSMAMLNNQRVYIIVCMMLIGYTNCLKLGLEWHSASNHGIYHGIPCILGYMEKNMRIWDTILGPIPFLNLT